MLCPELSGVWFGMHRPKSNERTAHFGSCGRAADTTPENDFSGMKLLNGITGTSGRVDRRRRRMATASDTKIDVTLAATLYSSYNAPLPSHLSSQPNSCDGLSLSQASSTSSSLHQPAKMGTIDKALARDKEWSAAVTMNEKSIQAARLRLVQ